MRKRITLILECESDDVIDLSDHFITEDIKQEIKCCSHFFEVKSIGIETVEDADDLLMKHRTTDEELKMFLRTMDRYYESRKSAGIYTKDMKGEVLCELVAREIERKVRANAE